MIIELDQQQIKIIDDKDIQDVAKEIYKRYKKNISIDIIKIRDDEDELLSALFFYYDKIYDNSLFKMWINDLEKKGIDDLRKNYENKNGWEYARRDEIHEILNINGLRRYIYLFLDMFVEGEEGNVDYNNEDLDDLYDDITKNDN